PNFRYTDYDTAGTLKDSVDHAHSSRRVSTSDGWIKMSVTHTVAENSPSRAYDQFAIFTSPDEFDGQIVNYEYMIDNIVVSVVE
ncbi:MAG: hypothetical protein J6K12_06105, partial [Clostridia bacterium]|nr:hypothetical protein [Clostridia bacterium]